MVSVPIGGLDCFRFDISGSKPDDGYVFSFFEIVDVYYLAEPNRFFFSSGTLDIALVCPKSGLRDLILRFWAIFC